MNYQIGDKVYYPRHGAGIIENVEEKDVGGKSVTYFCLHMPVGDMSLMIPADCVEKTGLRPVVSAETAYSILARIPELSLDMCPNWNKRYRDNMLLLKTGDMAWRDEDGYIWFEGRADDVIKCSGYRIGPFEVESALIEHPAVLEAAITAVPDPIRGQVVKATIVLTKAYQPSDELVKELQNHVKKATAPYKYPRIVEFVDELPKTSSGKIKRVDIRNKDAKQ